MNDLIKVAERAVGSGEVQTVNARELHGFLESGKDFSTWIKNRIEQYGFVENQDYVTAQELSTPKRGSAMSRPQLTMAYHLTIDMAKELAMVERTAKGKQARQYFIECERRAKAAFDPDALLADPRKLRAALLNYSDKVVELEAKVQAQAPAVEFHQAVTEAINCQTVQEVAKVLGTGPIRLYQFLREEGMLMTNNLPYQRHVDAGHFRVIERNYIDQRGERHIYSKTLVTGKGLALIQRRICRQSDLLELASA